MNKEDNSWLLVFERARGELYKVLHRRAFIAGNLRLCVKTFNAVNKGKKKLVGIHATAKNKYYIYEMLAKERKSVGSIKKAIEAITEWLKDPEVDTVLMTAEYENGDCVSLEISRLIK